ncbi:hypothetical protein WDW86_02475 [Bdellovibrionota bacterium FG-2]
MGQNKGLAQRIFNRKDFATITLDLELKNLTAATEILRSEAHPGPRESDTLAIGEAKTIEILEFDEDHIVLGSLVQFGALGHQVVLKVTVFSDDSREKRLFYFESQCKVTYFEKKLQGSENIYLAHLGPRSGDQECWNQLFRLYSEKQEQVNRFLEKVRGTE